MTPQQMRALADEHRNSIVAWADHITEMRAALRAAADQLEAVYWDRFQDGWNAALTPDPAPQEEPRDE